MVENVGAGQEPLPDNKLPNDIHNYITSIAEIIPERLERLKAVLTILTDPNRDSPVPKVGTIHFARWVLIDNESRLLFTTNFDGPWDVYLERFVELGSRELDAIWSNTRGYPERGSADVEGFKEFVRRTSYRNAAVYCAYPDSALKEVHSGLRARRQFREFLCEFEDM